MQFNLPPCRTPTGLGDTAALFGALDGLDQNGPGHTAVDVGPHDDVDSVSSTEVSEPNTAGDVTSSATSTTFSASRAKWTSSEDKELAALFEEVNRGDDEWQLGCKYC